MVIAIATTLLSLVVFVTLVSSLWLWLITAARFAISWNLLPGDASSRIESWLAAKQIPPRFPLVAWSDRRPVPWALVDLLLLAGIWVLASLAVQAVLAQLGWSPGLAELDQLSTTQQMAIIAGNLGVSLIILVIGLPLIAWRTRGTWSDFGIGVALLRDDLYLGLCAFAMLAPPVYILQGLLVTLWKPSKHPLMEMFKATPEPEFFALLLVSAAVMAPLFEELLFRVTLQGLLEKVFSFRYSPESCLVGGPLLDMGQQQPLTEAAIAEFEAASVSAVPPDNSDYSAAAIRQMHELYTLTAEQPELTGAQAWLPILGSSAVFALLHFSHGPDWIPLLLLAAGMGYLYQRTHRLVPSLTVHALLNALSMCALWVQVYTDK